MQAPRFIVYNKKAMMGYLKFFMRLFVLLILLSLIFPKQAHAYIDPGTGSIIIQFLIGVVVGGAALVKIFWHKISANIKRLFKRDGHKETKE